MDDRFYTETSLNLLGFEAVVSSFEFCFKWPRFMHTCAPPCNYTYKSLPETIETETLT